MTAGLWSFFRGPAHVKILRAYIGGTEEVTILELAQRIGALAGSKSEITLVPYEKVYNRNFQDMPRRVPDISRLKGAVGYAPTRTLDEILKDVIADRRTAPPESRADGL